MARARTWEPVAEEMVGANSKLYDVGENIDKHDLKSVVVVELLIKVEAREVV